MRLLVMFCLLLCSVSGWAAQPQGVRLDANGVSNIYPVVDTSDWLLTQPEPRALYAYPDANRLTHWGDDYYAQDWARGCGQTHGLRLFAGISGQVVWAGARGPYGNTVSIYDRESGFVLKYSHLSEVTVKVGDYALAGKTFVGRVGNTGNFQNTGCQSNGGSHLHLSLYKNVVNPNARPVATTSATAGTGPTQYAAPFGYATSNELIKGANNPTVFVLYHGTRVPVSFGSYVSHGWNFDKHQSVFNALKNRVVTDSQVNAVQQAHYFWPFRDHSLVKVNYASTVYQFEDGRKHALTGNIFSCRALRFGEVVEIPVGDRDQFAPLNDYAPNWCYSLLSKSLADWKKFSEQRNFGLPNWASYFYYPNWDPNWELRILDFKNSAGQTLNINLSHSLANPEDRYIGYHDPATGAWNGWYRMQ